MTVDSGTLYWLPRILARTDLDATSTLILVGIADHIGGDDRCHVKIAKLATYGRCSYPTAKRRLDALEAAGFLTRVQLRRDDGGKSVYRYRLMRDAFATAPSDQADQGGSDHQARGGVGSPGSAEGSDHLGDPTEVPPMEQPPKEPPTTRALTLIDAPSEFDIFWNEYPSKSGKGAARIAWGKARKKVAAGTILDGLRVYVASDKVARGVICNPATWLNQERWDDTPPPPAQSPRQHRKATATAAFVGDERPTGGVGRAFYGEDETNALMRATRQEIR